MPLRWPNEQGLRLRSGKRITVRVDARKKVRIASSSLSCCFSLSLSGAGLIDLPSRIQSPLRPSINCGYSLQGVEIGKARSYNSRASRFSRYVNFYWVRSKNSPFYLAVKHKKNGDYNLILYEKTSAAERKNPSH